MNVHTRAIFPYPLPRGLSAGAEVEILEIEDDHCVVRDTRGKEWTVAVVCLDPGHLVWVDGHWVPDAERAVS